LTLDQLKYFYEAARFQHVGKAAKFVHISPSAVSAAISTLESEFGCLLFNRTGKSIVLTEAGKRLRDEAEKLFDHVHAIKGTIQDKPALLRGHYRLGASHFLASHYLARAWSGLQNHHPELLGDISSLPTAQVLREVVSGTLDLALCFSPIQHPELNQIHLYRGQLLVAVRNGHPILKVRGKKAISELSNFPAVIHKGQPGVELCEAHPIFARYGILPKIHFSFDSDACAIERVVTSSSWTMIPDIVANAYSKRVKLITHPPDWDAPFFVALVSRKDRATNPAIEAIRLQLENLFARDKI
jgi:DNA-binding transcriptional LysR family regulator